MHVAGIAAIGAALSVVVGAGLPAQAAQTLGPVTDDIGVIKIPKGAPLVMGGYWVLSGADTALGLDQKRGVELAIKDTGGAIGGHPIRFQAEDSLCNAEGGQTAATKLASTPNIVIVVGPACSSEATPGAPILWRAGITDIGTSTTAPSLTAPDRKPDYDGFARSIYSDLEQGKGDAHYIHDVLKVSKVVTIHDGSPYASQLVAAFVKNFKGLGGTILSEEAIQPTDVDMKPLLTRIATSKPDLIYYPVFVAAASQLTQQARKTPGLETVGLIGGGSLMTADFIQAAGSASKGFRITYPDISPEAMGKGYPAFVERYKAAYGEAPVSGYHAMAYDGAMMAIKAIEKVAKTDAAGDMYIGRKALRDAVFASKFDGLAGPIDCDAHGQCASFKLAVYEFTNADPSTFKIGENPKKIYP